MKIRKIALSNVRRFAGHEALIENIGDGITTICADNECGKSTFFDALEALFFVDHKSQSQEIKSLQPYGGGAVEIAAEVEIEEAGESRLFRIEKRFLSRKTARIRALPSGRVVAQEDEAEAWIGSLLGGGLKGPAGLLWVRQGTPGFGPAGSGATEKRERERLRDARQTLLSSVGGQIDAVTGGRRMDDIVRACEKDLAALATKTGRPLANSPWARAVDAADELGKEVMRLEGLARSLSSDLKSRDEASRELARLEDPEEMARRAKALGAAREDLARAETHQERIEAARRAFSLSELTRDRARSALDAQARLTSGLETATRSLRACESAAQDARETLQQAQTDTRHSIQRHDHARTRLKRIRRAQMHVALEADLDGRRRALAEVDTLLKRLASHETDLRDASRTIAGNGGTEEVSRTAEAIVREIEKARAVREAHAATLSFSYERSGHEALIEGRAVPAGDAIAIVDPVEIDLPGFGRLTARPGAAQDRAGRDTLEDLEQRLEDLLQGIGCERIGDLRALVAARAAATSARSSAQQAIDVIAPGGADALRAGREALASEIEDMAARACTDGGGSAADEKDRQEEGISKIIEEVRASYRTGCAGGHDASAFELALAEANRTLEEAEETLESSRAHERSCTAASVEADTALRIARDTHETARRAVEEAQSGADQNEAQWRQDMEAAEKDLGRAGEALREMESTAPDIDLARAEFDRLQSVTDNTETRRAALRSEIAGLDGQIRARADDRVEERLEEARGMLEKEEKRAARYAFEVESLQVLRTELQAARLRARDTYFEPVLRELRPLVAAVYGGADVEMDGDELAIGSLVRNGTSDRVGALSGGAFEQIAILTRLAFARLYAIAGSPVPVILDDALVHSDDRRIEKMFTALTRAARDQQIIVFSCRSRAFEDLGGTRSKIRWLDDNQSAQAIVSSS